MSARRAIGLVDVAALAAQMARAHTRRVRCAERRIEAKLADIARAHAAALAAMSQRVEQLEARWRPRLVVSQSESERLAGRLCALDPVVFMTIREGVKNLPPALWGELAGECGVELALLQFCAAHLAGSAAS